ncbi:protein Shroom isoform X1 [Cardiocondyla obscurior]|uniref:protein Shroom isoform X1 n=1 Tax=Cardiocondyla obscurior TaxID=286306 RepID=UPI0039655DA2
MSSDLGTWTRGGPIYSSEGRSLKKRSRDRRRHSLHETHDQGRHRRKRCIPDGGDVGYTMTELQPSPPGYRVQDEAPGPPSCPPGSYKYASHGHGSEAANFKSATSYSQEGYGLKQSPPRSMAPNEYYRRRNDGRRPSTENDLEGGKKAAAVTSYNDGHKKNSLGCKNDCGYSENLGFNSFTLSLNERDEASPPPTPPVRDASSLKGVCYGPGHEKYPSWPSAPERHSDEDIHSSGHSGSHRSKSWTDHTNYPKEKPAQYTRPHTKRPNPAFTQQLKTVMERCEKIPAETYESRNRSSVEEEPRLWPRVDREGKALGDAEYVVPSPPEREQQSQTLTHVDLEAYVRGYQDPPVPQVDLYRETTLTQAGLEEYTRVQHSQQASYAQSEGYHSYVSSVDSTTNTPFLDRLRRDSEAVAQRPATSWEDTSREGRDSVVTTSSGSASSSETLKWHGSMSDVSVSSGIPPRQTASDRWHHGSMSDVSSVNGGILTQKSNNGCHDKWQSSMSDVSTSGIGSPKGRHSLDKWQSSMNERNKGQSRPSLPAVIGHCTTSASISDICQTSTIENSKWQESSLDDESLNDRSQTNQWNNLSRHENNKYVQPIPQSPTRQQAATASPQSSENWNLIHGSMSDVSQSNGIQCSKQLIAHSARVQTPQRHHSESVLYLDRERSKRKLYPVSTTQPQESTQSSRVTLSSPPQLQLSVAERINELEKQQQQQQMRYTYLDPEKRHRVSDPTLKAIQKKALLSYYERHHQASWRSEPQLAQGPVTALQSPQSPPPQPPPRPRPSSSRRASSASDYASGTWKENVSRIQNQGNNDLPSPKHQHSNSCSSLSTDLLGPVIVGPAISIDDWVPERPPKKPHLRNVYNERIPSPDLPPPSPPTVTESEVHDCDDPLPPPPPELSDDCFTERKSNNIHHPTEETAKINRERSCERHKSERHSIKRSKHNGKRDHDKPTGKSSPNSTKTGVQEQEQHQFVRSAATMKLADSDMILENGVSVGFTTHRMVVTGRSSLRYPSTQKLMVNGRIAPARRLSEERSFSSRSAAQLPDLISQRYSDSGNQRPAPQVPVEPRIIRQESMRVDGTRVDASGLLRNDSSQRLESSSGQRPQPQVPKNTDKNVTTSPSSRPNYLPITDVAKSSSKYLKSHSFSIGSPVKTGYEASSKLFPSESNPQKYHEPPKYVPNHHQQRLNDVTQRTAHGYNVLPPKYVDLPKQKPQPQCPTEKYGTDSPSSPPPPLAPRQSTPGRKSLPLPPRPTPPPPHSHQGQSKASYLAYRRERGAPDSEGSYKRTMSPTSRMDDWPPSRNHDDPVLLRVTPHHQLQQQHHHYNNHHQQQHSDLSKSYSVDALHHRLEDRCPQQQHSAEVVNKLSHDLNKKLQTSDARSRTNENNNNDNLEDRHQHHHHHYQEKRHPEKRHNYEQRRERLSPQSVEVLNDRNRQLERERRKLAASCEPLPQNREKQLREISGSLPITGDDSFRERSATIEMTSQNIELLNRRNEKKISGVSTSNSTIPTYSISTTTSSVATNYDNGWTKRHETQNLIEAAIFSDRPPPPISSPPRSPNNVETISLRGAVPRRSGSCSSTSSSGRSIDARVSPRALLSRSSAKSSFDSLTRNEAWIEYASTNRKVSSPTQTDNTGSWNRSSSPSRLSQSSDTESRIERLSASSKFRPGARSSTSSISSVSKTSSSSSPSSPVEEDKSSPRSSLCVSPQPGIEGLTMVQRTEVVLRVNATTSDAASQTDILEDTEQECVNTSQRPLPESRKKLPEEIECEELSKDLASQLSPNDKLVPILVPAPEHKKPTDYVSGLFRVEATLQPRTRRRLSLEESMASCSEDVDVNDKKHETIPSAPVTPLSADSTSPLSLTSPYFTTSEGKARFLTRYPQDVTAEGLTHQEDVPTAVPTNSLDLRQKKEELVTRLDRKLVVLRAEQEAVREEGEMNETLGARVASRVSSVARPPEASKYRNHVEEVGKITSLLLGLSGRLARVENALYGMPADHAERKILESKRDKLMDQLEEAKILKSNIDKRSVNMSTILAKYLNEEEFADYQHFINMKAKLIVDGREIQDKVKLGEEQLAALKEAID